MRMGNRDVDGTPKGKSLKFLGVEHENSGRGPIVFIGAVEHERWMTMGTGNVWQWQKQIVTVPL
ncbi:uncharacterized protein Bfra_006119 [Botrytis fragariae]|uniref:Uncharacterized protein n=1 Tax=Botrytis fragariae TaxID=1964551 RepID=A0A8H6AS21_9HELO|nr:uncharacterized protein Bfra_006119 [Botrytis fragariae]KAF5872756.1 hypothetical protein Bfra_006119 [Botrytis fragariae]